MSSAIVQPAARPMVDTSFDDGIDEFESPSRGSGTVSDDARGEPGRFLFTARSRPPYLAPSVSSIQHHRHQRSGLIPGVIQLPMLPRLAAVCAWRTWRAAASIGSSSVRGFLGALRHRPANAPPVPLSGLSEGRRLRMYRGSSLAEELRLLDSPVAVKVFNSSSADDRVPLLAVAAGPFVFGTSRWSFCPVACSLLMGASSAAQLVYRNLRAYFKFVVPPVPVDEREQQVWSSFSKGEVDMARACQLLAEARDAGAELSYRAQDALALASGDQVRP